MSVSLSSLPGKFKCSLLNVVFVLMELLYNCGMIFFILSFFVGYIFSFGLVRLWTIRLNACAGTHIEVFTFVRGGCENHRCHNKNPGRKFTGVRKTSCPEAMGWDSWWFWKKKQLVEIQLCARPLEIWSWTRRVQFVAYGMRLLGRMER